MSPVQKGEFHSGDAEFAEEFRRKSPRFLRAPRATAVYVLAFCGRVTQEFRRKSLRFLRAPRASAVYFLAFCSVVVGLLAFWLINRHFLAGEDATWQRIQQMGVWRVGMDPSFPPFELLDGEGRPIGYDVDLAQAVAARWGVQVQIVAIGFDGLTDALLAGKVDSVVSALPYDPRLTEDLSYSSSYFEAGVRLAVGEDSPIRGVDDLAGVRLAVEWGSTGDAEARKLQRADPSIQRLTFPNPQAAVNAALNGAADGVLVDGVTLRQMQGEGSALVAVGPALESNPYVIALPIGAHTLREAIDTALADFVTTGFLAELENRWFSGTMQQ